MRPIFLVPFALLAFLGSSTAETGSPLVRPSEARAGSLMIQGTEGYRAAPNLVTDVDIRVTGLIARTEVTQRFLNPTEDWVEGIYVFPLPENSAVDSLEMRVGDRILEGQIKERAKARAVYARAKQEGRIASLVEQERPNIFTTSVANLGPGEEVVIRIAYQEDARYELGRFSLRFPMVVGPRYIPGGPTPLNMSTAGPNENGWSTSPTSVSDADRITPPLASPVADGEKTVSIVVRLDPGFRLESVRSPSHPIDVDARPEDVYGIELNAGRVPADSDFILEWTPVVGAAPTAALFHEEWEGEHYALIMLMPPKPEVGDALRVSRETIFVIDTSGSMGGESILQARNALDLALADLRPEDSFNIIRFDSSFAKLFPESRKADAVSISEARRWVSRLQASGGTEILPALRAALAQDVERSAVRQVIFITDGAVGNEDALFRTIHERLGDSRLYTIGIGSAPNAHFMTRAAEFGRGTFTFISSPDQVEQKMRELFAKLSSPLLHHIDVRWPIPGVEFWPRRIPDVYLGQPIVVAARLPRLGDRVQITGRRGTERVEMDLPLTAGSRENGIARLWARRKIKSLVDTTQRGADRDRVAQEVTALGIRHHIVTKWTSLVAVDITPSRPVGVETDSRAVPTLLPKGWTLRGLFGGSPPGKVPKLAPDRDLSRVVAHSPKPMDVAGGITSQPNGFAARGRLPQGGTPAALLVWLGSALFGLSALLWRSAPRP
jgi:Ca-activated chloride channel homolog